MSGISQGVSIRKRESRISGALQHHVVREKVEGQEAGGPESELAPRWRNPRGTLVLGTKGRKVGGQPVRHGVVRTDSRPLIEMWR